jgi:LmbE family N-acetylglucosaminyl deacetylase
MVFAPHPDDETLGCGGTLLLKRRLKARVELVVLTDGAGSHPGLLSRDEMRALRAREVMEAAGLLGIGAPSVHLLGLPDGALAEHREEAVSRIIALLEEHRPEQLFVPYGPGEPRDHGAACAIVHEAARRVGRPVTVFEYPIWAWRYWPYVNRGGSPWSPWTWLWGCASTGRGLLRFTGFRTVVPIQDVVEGKQAALARHASQVERWNGSPEWKTLRDVDGGEFLDCFFSGIELYRRIELGP